MWRLLLPIEEARHGQFAGSTCIVQGSGGTDHDMHAEVLCMGRGAVSMQVWQLLTAST